MEALSASLTPTKVVLLGVKHSAQLVAGSYQPAMFRAFMDRVNPLAICVARGVDPTLSGASVVVQQARMHQVDSGHVLAYSFLSQSIAYQEEKGTWPSH
jgi:hypothetical protein